MEKKIVELSAEFGITQEQKAEALVQYAIQTAIGFTKEASTGALQLIAQEFKAGVEIANISKIEADTAVSEQQLQVQEAQIAEVNAGTALKNKQIELTARQIQGFDDQLLIKVAEFQSGLASFAVNAGSDTAQDTINDLKTKMQAVETRALPLTGEPVCPVPTAITEVPAGIVTGEITSSSFRLTWNPVIGATSYQVWKDGVGVATVDTFTFVDSGLLADTKYAYSIKASKNGILSNFSPATVITTLA